MRIESDADDARPTGLDAVSAGELLRATRDPTITVGRDGTVRTANRAVETVLGHAPDTIVGEPAATLLPARFFGAAVDVASEYLETGTSPVGTRNLEVFARHADGHEVPLSVTLVEHDQGGERVVTLVGREITDRIDRDAALTRERDRLAGGLDALAAAPDPATHAVSDLVADAWDAVETGDETLAIDVACDVVVDADRARSLFRSLLAATAPLDGTVAVDGGRLAADGDTAVDGADSGGADVRISGSAVATDLGAAPALARAMDVPLERGHTSIAIAFCGR